MRQISISILVVLLAGCSAPEPVRLQSRSIAPMPAAVEAPVAPPVQVVSRIEFKWNRSTDARVTGYRLYAGPASGEYAAFTDVGNVDTATVTNAPLPSYVTVTALANGGESAYGNEVGLLGWDEVLQIVVYTNSAAGLTDWRPVTVVWSGTNVQGNGFWKLEGRKQKQLNVKP